MSTRTGSNSRSLNACRSNAISQLPPQTPFTQKLIRPSTLTSYDDPKDEQYHLKMRQLSNTGNANQIFSNSKAMTLTSAIGAIANPLLLSKVEVLNPFQDLKNRKMSTPSYGGFPQANGVSTIPSVPTNPNTSETTFINSHRPSTSHQFPTSEIVPKPPNEPYYREYGNAQAKPLAHQQINSSTSSSVSQKSELRYLSIKETIAAYKEVELRLMIRNDPVKHAPLIISANQTQTLQTQPSQQPQQFPLGTIQNSSNQPQKKQNFTEQSQLSLMNNEKLTARDTIETANNTSNNNWIKQPGFRGHQINNNINNCNSTSNNNPTLLHNRKLIGQQSLNKENSSSTFLTQDGSQLLTNRIVDPKSISINGGINFEQPIANQPMCALQQQFSQQNQFPPQPQMAVYPLAVPRITNKNSFRIKKSVGYKVNSMNSIASSEFPSGLRNSVNPVEKSDRRLSVKETSGELSQNSTFGLQIRPCTGQKRDSMTHRSGITQAIRGIVTSGLQRNQNNPAVNPNNNELYNNNNNNNNNTISHIQRSNSSSSTVKFRRQTLDSNHHDLQQHKSENYAVECYDDDSIPSVMNPTDRSSRQFILHEYEPKQIEGYYEDNDTVIEDTRRDTQPDSCSISDVAIPTNTDFNEDEMNQEDDLEYLNCLDRLTNRRFSNRRNNLEQEEENDIEYSSYSLPFQIQSNLLCLDSNTIYVKPKGTNDCKYNSKHILLINAENLLFSGLLGLSYWEKSINPSSLIDANLMTYQWQKQLAELKKTLRLLSKHYWIALLFREPNSRVIHLIQFLLRNAFTFDAAYATYLIQSKDSRCIYSSKSINVTQIISDANIQSARKTARQIAKQQNIQPFQLLYFDLAQDSLKLKRQPQIQQDSQGKNRNSISIKCNLEELSNQTESNQIPIIFASPVHEETEEETPNSITSNKMQNMLGNVLNQAIDYSDLHAWIPVFPINLSIKESRVILVKQQRHSNVNNQLTWNSRQILEAALDFLDSSHSKENANINISQNQQQKTSQQQGHHSQRQSITTTERLSGKLSEFWIAENVIDRVAIEGNRIEKQNAFWQEIQEIKNEHKSVKDCLDVNSDKVAESFRNRLIEYLKSTQKVIPNLYYLVGDLVMRNRHIFNTYSTHPFHVKKKTALILTLFNQFKTAKQFQKPSSNQRRSSSSSNARIKTGVVITLPSSKDRLVKDYLNPYDILEEPIAKCTNTPTADSSNNLATTFYILNTHTPSS